MFGEVNIIEDFFIVGYFLFFDEIEYFVLFKQFGVGNQISFLYIVNKVEEVIYFIFFLMGRFNIFKCFMINYEEVCLKIGVKIQFYVILFNDSNVDIFINVIGGY